jgi:hypothetical protein
VESGEESEVVKNGRYTLIPAVLPSVRSATGVSALCSCGVRFGTAEGVIRPDWR